MNSHGSEGKKWSFCETIVLLQKNFFFFFLDFEYQKHRCQLFLSLCILYVTYPQTSGQMTLEPIRKKDLYLQTQRENYMNTFPKYGSHYRRYFSLCSNRIFCPALLQLAFFGSPEVNREKSAAISCALFRNDLFLFILSAGV